MWQQGLISSQVFSMYLSGLNETGEIIFGGSDPNHFTGSFAYVPVSVQGYWQIQISSASMKGNSLGCNGCNAIIDSGTSFVSLEKNKKNILK